MASDGISERDLGLLALRALAGERVPLLLGRRRYTLSVEPIFRILDGGDRFLYLCAGLESLKQRLRALGARPESSSNRTVAELGGAQGSH